MINDDNTAAGLDTNKENVVTSEQANKAAAPGKEKSRRSKSAKSSSSRRNRESSSAPSLFFPNPFYEYSKRALKKIKGKKQYQRHENFCFLLSLMNKHDLEHVLDESGYYEDLVDSKFSPFTKLLLDENSLKAWASFNALTEEEQNKYIEDFDEIVKSSHHYFKQQLQNGEVLEDATSEQESAANKLKLADYHFQRIDKNIRNIMKRQIGLPLVSQHEQNIVPSIEKSPDAPICIQAESGFERLMLHGFCQYFSLKVKSVNKSDGEKLTQISTKTFVKPPVMLSEYINIKFSQ